MKAQKALDRHEIRLKSLKVSFSTHMRSGKKTNHKTNLYLSNLDHRMKTDDLERYFKICGYVFLCTVLQIQKVYPNRSVLSDTTKLRMNGELSTGFMDSSLKGQIGELKSALREPPVLPKMTHFTQAHQSHSQNHRCM